MKQLFNIKATAKSCIAFVVLQDEFYSVWYILAHSSYADLEEVKKAISIEVFKDSVKYRMSNERACKAVFLAVCVL